MTSDPAASARQMPAVLRRLLENPSAAGLLLMGAAALAMVIANSPLAGAYAAALGSYVAGLTVLHWINDGLMAVFFLLVGLEIKREVVEGRLSTWAQRRLPALPAVLGMMCPAAIYLLVAGGEGNLNNGWAIPAATDIAFAMGVLGLLGTRAPIALKLFLVTVAIVDDMGAVAIIALFYTETLNVTALAAAGAILAVMMVLNRRGVQAIWPYLLAFAALWCATLLSGIHATIAGVLTAFLIPAQVRDASGPAPLQRLEHSLAPWVGLLILPIFGFANAGVSLGGLQPSDILDPLPLAVALGLLVGKQVGVFGGVFIAVKTGLAAKPRGATWLQIYGVALLCGVGFTMSLFIGGLAFPGAPALAEEAKIGILMGSLLSALAGFLVLRFAPAAEEEPVRPRQTVHP